MCADKYLCLVEDFVPRYFALKKEKRKLSLNGVTEYLPRALPAQDSPSGTFNTRMSPLGTDMVTSSLPWRLTGGFGRQKVKAGMSGHQAPALSCGLRSHRFPGWKPCGYNAKKGM